jgi:hypothetical protein
MTEEREEYLYDSLEQDRIDAAAAGIDWGGMMCFTQLQDIRGYLLNGSCVMLSPEALSPFAAWSAEHLAANEFELPDDRVRYRHNNAEITLGDMRKAVLDTAPAEDGE